MENGNGIKALSTTTTGTTGFVHRDMGFSRNSDGEMGIGHIPSLWTLYFSSISSLNIYDFNEIFKINIIDVFNIKTI